MSESNDYVNVERGTAALAIDYAAEIERAGEAVIQVCAECKTAWFTPRLRCPKCHSARSRWTAAGTSGTVATFVAVEASELTPSYAVPSRLTAAVPYVTAFVELDSYRGVRVPALMAPNGGTDVLVGARVELSVAPGRRPHLLARSVVS